MSRLRQSADRPVRIVYACQRHNHLINQIERKVTGELFPDAEILSTLPMRGDCGPIDGLLDIEDACRRLAGEDAIHGDVLVQKLSSMGHYAGVRLRGVTR
jgi:hypothetical protein